jgi:RimJ/RimL family protein N-acetyltransferase
VSTEIEPIVPLVLRTDRLLLRPWRATDAAVLLPLLRANEAHLAPWIPPGVAAPVPEEELAERLSGFAADFAAARAWRYAIFSRDESRSLGEVDLFPRDAAGRVAFPSADRLEIGYWLDAAATGRGLATEAARAMLGVATGLSGMTRVEIRCNARNAPSAALPRRLGFTLASEEADAGVDPAAPPITLQLWTLALSGVGRRPADVAPPATSAAPFGRMP